MKKIISLTKATMSNDMSLFKIYSKKNNKLQKIAPLIIGFYLMIMIWFFANTLFEKVAPYHLQVYQLTIFAFSIVIMTFIEGIYKSGAILFKCKDDSILLPLPISKKTILLIRMFKFYVFEVLYNSLFLLPIMLAYIRWAESLTITYFITSILFLLIFPIIPIILSCTIGVITSSVVANFKHKNAMQTVLSMIFLIGSLMIYTNIDSFLKYFIKNIANINEILTKIYYPIGMYLKLLTNFQIIDVIKLILVHSIIIVIFISILEKFYFKINSKTMVVRANKNKTNNAYKVIAHNQRYSLIKKELSTFFNTPVLIINAGFALVLYLLIVLYITIKIDGIMNILTNIEGIKITKEILLKNSSIYIFLLVSMTSFLTSITNSSISLEGKNINILKVLPIKPTRLLLAKIESYLIVTTIPLWLGIIILYFRLKLSLIDTVLLLILSVLLPLISHFIGILVNLKYPKFDATNQTEIVKQSMSSFLSVMIGMLLIALTYSIVGPQIGKIKPHIILSLAILISSIINIILSVILIKLGVKEFNKLSI